MWDDGFEPIDNLLNKGNVFKSSNKDAKKRQSKIRKKTLIFHHCGLLGKRSLDEAESDSKPYKMLRSKIDHGDLNEEQMGMIVHGI